MRGSFAVNMAAMEWLSPEANQVVSNVTVAGYNQSCQPRPL